MDSLIKKILSKLTKKNDIEKINTDLERLPVVMKFGKEGAKLLGYKKGGTPPKKQELTREIIEKESKYQDKKDKIMFFKKKYLNKLLLALGIVLVINIPVIFNFIARQPSKHVIGDVNDWISFFGSYLGGVIGGIITLIGVQLTIKNQTKEKIIDEFPKKELNLNAILGLIEEQKQMLLIKNNYDKVIENIVKSEQDMIEKAIHTSPATYKVLRNFFDYIKLYKRTPPMVNNKDLYDTLNQLSIIVKKIQASFFDEYVKSSSR
ncbi:hypothetical protein [Halobacillus sp. A5]|uniref:hypothetical protein n=1 Tax=Halobacillus sp. A5 TaxID=2880263 RepID=UPI0020A6B356|nr:hypothetical protein [Halobacillus sp. A5]MCP3029642.1 hypothetical protein [Halobacillus sp. A5]